MFKMRESGPCVGCWAIFKKKKIISTKLNKSKIPIYNIKKNIIIILKNKHGNSKE